MSTDNLPEPGRTRATLAFHWSYILLPALILLLSIVLTAYFYRLLPAELAYHFRSDGSPDRWLNRGTFTLWMLLPQLFLTLVAGSITWGITRLGALFRQPGNTLIRPEGILSAMGNMIGLPQAVLCFAMLNVFSYNSYQRQIMPLWVFALIVMTLGGIFLAVFFIRGMRQGFRKE